MNKNDDENILFKIGEIVDKILKKSDLIYSSIIKIGQGSFGNVFKIEYAYDLSKNYSNKFVIKLFNSKKKNVEISARNELIILNKTRNKNILKTFGPIDSDNLYKYENYNFILLEYYQYNLKKFTNKFFFSIFDIKNIADQIINGLYHLKEKGIIHRDIKSENILISKINKVTKVAICDFGSIELVEDKSPTVNNSKITTIEYRAPELMMRNKEFLSYDISIDYWSFGCILVELIRKLYKNQSNLYLFGKRSNIISIINFSIKDDQKNEEKLLNQISKLIKDDLNLYLEKFKTILNKNEKNICSKLEQILKGLIKYDDRLNPKDILSILKEK